MPNSGNPSIPVFPILKKELPLYDHRVVVLWDPKSFLNEDQAKVWHSIFNEITNSGEDRMVQIGGYKVLTKPHWLKQYKKDRIYISEVILLELCIFFT